MNKLILRNNTGTPQSNTQFLMSILISLPNNQKRQTKIPLNFILFYLKKKKRKKDAAAVLLVIHSSYSRLVTP
jgi:hypothetical protein